MKAKPALTTCTVRVRATCGTYLATVEETLLASSCTMGAEHAARIAAGRALRCAPDHVVLMAIPGGDHLRSRYTATAKA